MHDPLVKIVGPENVREGVGVADASSSRGVEGRAEVLVRPGSAGEVAAVVAWCYANETPVVPLGGATGFSGGAVPLGPACVISLERLDRVRSFEPQLWRMNVEAGVRTAHVARLARENGLLYPPDPGAAEQSQIGGNVATNAGGPHAFKYGTTGAWVTGLEAVLAPGELVTVGGPVRKDVAGYDLRSLLVGSEGTLGIVTAVWLRLIPAPAARHVLRARYADAEQGCAAILRVLECGAQPAALEFLDAGAHAHAGGSGFVVIAEADGSAEEAAAQRELLREALGADTEEVADRAALWRWRDGVSIAVTAARGGKLSEDICVPVERLAQAIEETVAIGARHGLEACSWGHAGDGNLHSTFLLDPGDAQQLARAEAAARDLFSLAVALGGTVSGEHGVGAVKRGALSLQWAPAAVAAHEAIKRALDPRGLLNPGKKSP